MILNKRMLAFPIPALILAGMLGLTGCTPTQSANDVAALESALGTLIQNRSLTEQFVRDVKSSAAPGDPAYQEVMESYNDARDAYNHFLDTVETGTNHGTSQKAQLRAAVDAQEASAQFLREATRTLNPSFNTRGIDFQRAIQIPDTLPHQFCQLPRKARGTIIEKVDRQIRWRSWGQM